ARSDVAGEHVRAGDTDLAGLASGDFGVRPLGTDRDVDARKRNAERATVVRHIDPVEEAHRARLGEAVGLSQLRPGQLEPSVLQLDSERSAAADAQAEAGGAERC